MRECRTCVFVKDGAFGAKICVKNPPLGSGFPRVDYNSGCAEWVVASRISSMADKLMHLQGTPEFSPIFGVPEGIKECYFLTYLNAVLDYLEGKRENMPVIKKGVRWSA